MPSNSSFVFLFFALQHFVTQEEKYRRKIWRLRSIPNKLRLRRNDGRTKNCVLMIFLVLCLFCTTQGFLLRWGSLRSSSISSKSSVSKFALNSDFGGDIIRNNTLSRAFEADNSRGIIPTGSYLIDNDENVNNKIIKKDKIRSPSAQKYFNIVDKLTPNEMIAKFATTAPKNVQEAAKSTVMTILGSLPNYALDAALITTSTKLANLLYQMQMTGYMFKNAEYRMTLTRSLKGLPRLPAPASLNKGNITVNQLDNIYNDANIQLRASTGEQVSVAVSELTGALSKEVQELRQELALIRGEREAELRSNLLTYIQALPENELGKLTSDMSQDIVDSIQMLVDALMEKLGIDTSGPEVVVQQSIGPLAQLCMWQMVVGYKLRELEVLDKGMSD